jgi:ferrous iron transport protein B
MKRIVLAGNPNCGKTTFFNTLTGSKQHVGNWPGKTVEKKSAILHSKNDDVEIIDLPGAYSLTSYSSEEEVTRDYLLYNNSTLVVDIVDATNIERNLFFALELIELGVNVFIVINMANLATKNGMEINFSRLEELLSVPVFVVDARDKKQVKSVFNKILDYSIDTSAKKFSLNYGDELEEHITAIQNIFETKIGIKKNNSLNTRWLSVKLLENDLYVEKYTGQKKNGDLVLIEVNKIKLHLKKVFGENFQTIVTDKRFGFTSGITKEVVKRQNTKKTSFTDNVDKIVLNKYFSIPIFLLIIYIMFMLTFKLSTPFVDMLNHIFSYISNLIPASTSISWLSSFIKNGVIGGIGSVLVFLPSILILFFLIAILEDSGYFARVAYVMDPLMHKIGLHGKSSISLILGFGCNVSAIMTTRSLDNKKDRIVTMLITPFMSCSARLPIYVLFVGAFFPKNQGVILFSLYVLGIIVAIISAYIFNKLFFRGEKSELLMELPSYRLPTLQGAVIHTWEKGKYFIYKAGTFILAFSLLIWFLSSFPLGVEYASENSFLGIIGKAISPIFAPLGFGSWQIATALLFGIVAKEVVISTLGAIYGVGSGSLSAILSSLFTPLSAYVFMVFTLLYFPCIATFAVIKKETNSWKWPIISVIYSLIIAWLLAFIIYSIGLFMGFG